MHDHYLSSLPYPDNLGEHYHALSQLPGFVLLESSDKQRGRYDIVSAYPYDNLRLPEKEAQNAFELLESKLPKRNFGLDLPFQGGAIGYLSYDLGAKLVGINAQQQPLLLGMPCIDIGFYDWAIIIDHLTKEVIIFAANTQSQTPMLIEEIISLWQRPINQFNLSSYTSFTPMITKEEYREAFIAIHTDLQKGRNYQVNYTQPFQAEFTGDSFDIYKRIRQHNPIPFGAFLKTLDADILCFSPERFITMDKGILKTSPIKGTAKSSVCAKEDLQLREELQNCLKNRAENVMIVDLLRNDFGKIAKTGSVHVSTLCAVESYRGLHHLVSEIEAHCLDHITPIQALKACFPGGSITGTPKLEAMHIIHEKEKYGRGVYCGSIGYFSTHGRFDTNIAIRTMTARNHQLHLAAGGGIVINSDWEKEYEECLIKIKSLDDLSHNDSIS